MTNTLLMLASPAPLAEAARAVLADVAPDWSIHIALTAAEALPIAPEARAIFAFPPFFSDAVVRAAQQVEWVQSMGTGVDGMLGRAGLPPGVIVSATRGVHGPVMSEFGMTMMLALARGLPRYQRHQVARHWQQFPATLLEGKTVGIVGMGDIAATRSPNRSAGSIFSCCWRRPSRMRRRWLTRACSRR
jgi:D-2-hydroxyacid dehydrogenase (NADP+)